MEGSLTSQLYDQEIFNISQITLPNQVFQSIMFAVMILLDYHESWISVAAKLNLYTSVAIWAWLKMPLLFWMNCIDRGSSPLHSLFRPYVRFACCAACGRGEVISGVVAASLERIQQQCTSTYSSSARSLCSRAARHA